jgi:hypothetical protein
MVQRVDVLTAEQAMQLPAYADRWIEIALRTGAADRGSFEPAVRRCYEPARIDWHGKVVWVASPGILALAGPIAAVLVRLRQSRLIHVQRAATEVARKVSDANGWPVSIAVRRCLSDELRQAVEHELELPLVRALQSLHGSVDAAMSEAVDQVTREGLANEVRVAVDEASGGASDEEVREAIGCILRAGWGGTVPSLSWAEQWWPWGAPATSYLREVCGLALDEGVLTRARALEDVTRSACCWFPYRTFVMACEWPREIHFDDTHRDRTDGDGVYRLHRMDGPAVCWSDGWSIHAFQGRRVPAWVIEHPEAITADRIEREENAEVRRVMIERHGWARYIADSGARVVDQAPSDHPIAGLRGARLLRKDLPGEPEPIVFLEMINSTPEPDGTYRRYLERIDPKAYRGAAGRLCQAAMASRWHYRDGSGQLRRTFADWRDYRPTAES